jgi:hypothetical protein
MERLIIITEPLLDPHFVQFEVTVPILERFTHQYQVVVAAPRITPSVRVELERRGIQTVDGGALFPPLRRPRDELPSYVGSWGRDTLWGWNRRDLERALAGQDGLRINISMTSAVDADVWFIQSRPLGYVLETMGRGLRGGLGVVLGLAQPIVAELDLRHIQEAGRRATARYTSTRHVANWFAAHGLPVEEVIPVYYRTNFCPSTSRPSRDYLLAYLGKETDTEALLGLLRTGLPVRMFGSKSAGWVLRKLRLERFPNARYLGHVTDEELRELYSNALFTAFPFTEESFGLIPVESMACGTPVLTYGFQGPAETVLDGRTGWFATSPEDFVRRAQAIWRTGVPAGMSDECRVRARRYHLDTVRADWARLIETAEARGRIPLTPQPRAVRPSVVRLPRLLQGVPFPQVRASPVLGASRLLARPDTDGTVPRDELSDAWVGRSTPARSGVPRSVLGPSSREPVQGPPLEGLPGRSFGLPGPRSPSSRPSPTDEPLHPS